jgi:hypothetical protein
MFAIECRFATAREELKRSTLSSASYVEGENAAEE